jgi:hypothetical protein
MRGCYYCYLAGRVAPPYMVGFAVVLWILNVSRELNFTAGWIVVFAAVFAGGHWLLGRSGK